MREEIMTVSICWELQAKVTAEYAYARKDLMYFCPERECLNEVRASLKKRHYFYALERHVDGCPNQPPVKEVSPVPGAPRPRLAPEREPVLPTVLGPPPSPAARPRPSRADLMALAHTIHDQPVQQSGTLEEVIDAWVAMPPHARATYPLTVGSLASTYSAAFQFLGSLAPEISELEPVNRVVYGAARVSEGGKYFFIWSRKTFNAGEKRIPLRIDVNKDFAPEYYRELIGRDVTFFWTGPWPVPTLNERDYCLRVEFDGAYQGVAIREGQLGP